MMISKQPSCGPPIEKAAECPRGGGNRNGALPVSIGAHARVPRRRNRGFTLVELLVVVTLIAVIIGLLLVGVQKVREGAARTQSTNNLKQIVLAFHGFHDAYARLPYNGTVSPYGHFGWFHGGPALQKDQRTGCWAFQALPYLEQEPMFNSLDSNIGLAVFMCPGRGRPALCTGNGGPGAWSDYFLNSFLNDPNGAYNVPDTRRTLVGILDGASNTILVGHGQINPATYLSVNTTPGFTDVIFNGGSASNCRPNANVVNGPDSAHPASQAGNWGGPFAAGSLMGMADGTVRVFPYHMTGGTIFDGECITATGGVVFGDFLTPSGGESPDTGEDAMSPARLRTACRFARIMR